MRVKPKFPRPSFLLELPATHTLISLHTEAGISPDAAQNSTKLFLSTGFSHPQKALHSLPLILEEMLDPCFSEKLCLRLRTGSPLAAARSPLPHPNHSWCTHSFIIIALFFVSFSIKMWVLIFILISTLPLSVLPRNYLCLVKWSMNK